MPQSVNIYLAGPTVFLKNAIELGQAKKDILARYGMTGHFPFDNEIDFSAFPSIDRTGIHIGAMNFAMMDRCDTVIADLTPFHGPSADVGTYGECLYMYGKGKMVNGYSNDTRLFADRVVSDHYDGDVTTENNGVLVGSDGIIIENFDLFDNLMLPAAIENTGGIFMSNDVAQDVRYTDLECFERVAQALALKLGV